MVCGKQKCDVQKKNVVDGGSARVLPDHIEGVCWSHRIEVNIREVA